MIEVNEILENIANKRLIFHSEADFQHALAWEIHNKLPNAAVRLELPIKAKGQNLHVDVWIENKGEVLAIELKYKTRALSVLVNEEQFNLKNQSAQDTGRYDFIKDIQRLEHIAKEKRNFVGYAILLTNDSSYWVNPANNNTVDADFRINEGRVIEGTLWWGENASDGTKKNRETTLVLQEKYFIRWKDFSSLIPVGYGRFRSLTIKVDLNQ